MNIYTMRELVAEAYVAEGWKTRVKQMNDDQILAIYKRMKNDGDLYKHKRRSPKDLPEFRVDENGYLTKDEEGRNIFVMRRIAE